MSVIFIYYKHLLIDVFPVIVSWIGPHSETFPRFNSRILHKKRVHGVLLSYSLVRLLRVFCCSDVVVNLKL